MRALAAPTLALGVAALGSALAARGGGGELLAVLCGSGRLAGSSWTLDPIVTFPLLVSAALYGVGAARSREAASGTGAVTAARAAAFAAGWLGLAGALVSPIHRWGEGSFTFHMIEHEIVMAAAAPLLVLARPGAEFLLALPVALRRVLKLLGRSGPVRATLSALTRPVTATILHGIAIWAWHAPGLFDAAVADASVHRLQHAAFLLTALLFWWSLLNRAGAGAAVGHLFVTMLHTSVLGALLAFAPRVLYPRSTASAPDWGLTALQDQQLAGVLMWVPAGTVYAGAALLFAATWIRGSGAAWTADDAVAKA